MNKRTFIFERKPYHILGILNQVDGKILEKKSTLFHTTSTMKFRELKYKLLVILL